MKKKVQGFTLIELLVVVAIIGILAAILFPVFARARENARRSSCMSNLKQIGLGVMMYAQDYDERLPMWTYTRPRPWESQYDISGTTTQFIWFYALLPYVKNWQLFNCPSGADAQKFTGLYNSRMGYGFNYQAPAVSGGLCGGNCGQSLSGIALAAVEAPTETIGFVDAVSLAVQARMSTAGVWPTLAELQTGVCDVGRDDANCVAVRHFDTVNTVFLDGHVKPMQWQSLMSPNGIHYWTSTATPVIP